MSRLFDRLGGGPQRILSTINFRPSVFVLAVLLIGQLDRKTTSTMMLSSIVQDAMMMMPMRKHQFWLLSRVIQLM